MQRFWDKVEVGEPNECWNWTGSKFQAGYGAIYFKGKTMSAHRLSYALANEYDHPSCIEGMVLHTCDNRACVNPAHLRIGNARDNMRDAVDRGRWHRPRNPKGGTPPIRRGSANGNSKLSPDQVRRIASELGSARSVGRRFNINHKTVMAIRRGERRPE